MHVLAQKSKRAQTASSIRFSFSYSLELEKTEPESGLSRSLLILSRPYTIWGFKITEVHKGFYSTNLSQLNVFQWKAPYIFFQKTPWSTDYLQKTMIWTNKILRTSILEDFLPIPQYWMVSKHKIKVPFDQTWNI